MGHISNPYKGELQTMNSLFLRVTHIKDKYLDETLSYIL